MQEGVAKHLSVQNEEIFEEMRQSDRDDLE
jgi:hypothetical protein